MQKREKGIDFLKTLAIINVVVIHVVASGCYLNIGTSEWIANVFYGSAARYAVPVFFMCSGALLLDPAREISIKKLWSKNMLKIVVPLFLWAAFYKLFGLAAAKCLNKEGFINELKEFLLFDHEFHLYYLHIMILVYAFLPITRLITCNAEKKVMEYYLLFWIVSGIAFPTVIVWKPFSLIKGFPLEWKMNMTWSSIGYTVLGYYLKKYPLSKKKSLLLFLSGFLLTFIPVVLLSFKYNYFYEHLWMGMAINIFLMAAGVYGLGVNTSLGGKLAEYISKASFTVYLCHVVFLRIFEALGMMPSTIGYTWISVPLISAAILLLSFIVYEILKRIPILNRFI